jgi:hypothetical protein
VQQSLQLNEEEVEEFLIDVIKTRLVRAKISQVITSVLPVPTVLYTVDRYSPENAVHYNRIRIQQQILFLNLKQSIR